MRIETATPREASLIADAILGAIGPELTDNLAGQQHTAEDVHALFTRLAARDDTQYSYLNSRIARDDEGNVMGVCVSYDGARLRELRRPFFDEANRNLGWDMTPEQVEDLPGETEPDEFYLDTLMTLPEFRRQGVGRALIEDAAKKAARTGKPLGLLCEPDNMRAHRLYESVGFRKIGSRPFAGHLMDHLQIIQ